MARLASGGSWEPPSVPHSLLVPSLTGNCCADNKYNNKTLQQWMSRNKVVYEIEINSKPEGEGFKPIRIRWVVEQAHACHGRCRRLSKDYERRTSSSEAWVQLSAIQRMIRRLKPDPDNRQAKFKYPKNIKNAA